MWDAAPAIILWAFALVIAILTVIQPREFRAILVGAIVIALAATWADVLRPATELSSDGKSVQWRTPIRKGSIQLADIVSIEFSRNGAFGSNRTYRRIVPFNGTRVVIHYTDGFDAFLMSIGASDRDMTQPDRAS